MTKKIESNNLKCTLSLHLPVTIAVGKHLASFLTVSLIWVIERRQSLVTDKGDVNQNYDEQSQENEGLTGLDM